MAILKLTEQEWAKSLVHSGHSYIEAAEIIITQRGLSLRRPIADEIATLDGRKSYPLRERSCGKTLQEIKTKRLARGDVEEEGVIYFVRGKRGKDKHE